MNNQKGVVLLSVMILTTMTSIIVLNSLRDNFIQERLTGNYQKKMNARLVSEKGIFETHKLLQDKINNNPNISKDDIIRVGEEGSGNVSGSASIDDMVFNAKVSQNSDGLIEIRSLGSRYEGLNNTVALFDYIQSIDKSFPFEQFLVGCSGVGVKAGGSVNSYDSRDPTLDYSNKANISTLNKNSDVLIDGGALVWGDVTTTGTISVTGGTSVAGTLHANSDITISGGSGVEMPVGTIEGTRVTEDILTKGSVDFVGGVGGVVRAEGNLSYGTASTTFISNLNNEEFALKYSGANLTTNDESDTPRDNDGTLLSHAKFKQTVSVAEVEAVAPNNIRPEDLKNPKKSCDFLQITSEFSHILNGMGSFDDLDLSRWDSRFELSSQSGSYIRGGSSSYSPVSKHVFGTTQSIFFFNNVEINGGRLVFKKSDNNLDNETIHVFVKGDWNYSANGGSQIEIQEGVSVVVYILGKAVFKKPFASDSSEGFRQASKTPSFTIYSAYNDKASSSLNCQRPRGPWGVEMSGTGDMYGVIYSPYSDVFIGSSTVFKGAIRANTITACGAGSVHYDVALGEYSVGDGDGGGTSRLVFKGWRYL